MTPEHAQQAEIAIKGILDMTPDGPDKRLLESFIGTLAVYNEVTATQEAIARIQITEPVTKSAEELLGSLVLEYRKYRHSPEVLTRFNRAFYEVYARRVDLEIDVQQHQG